MLFTDTDSLMYEMKTEDVYKDFRKDKQMFDSSNYSAKSKYFHDLNKLVLGLMKDKISCIVIEKFFGLKPKMHLFFVDASKEQKKQKVQIKNIVVIIRDNKYKDVLLHNSLCHSMNRIKEKRKITI